MPRGLGHPSAAYHYVPKPPTHLRRSNLFDSRWLRRSRDISQSGPCKCHLFQRITNVYQSTGQLLPLTKGLGLSSCYNPHFFLFFYQKKPIKLPLGTDHLVKPCICFTRDHCIVGDLISLVGTFCQQHVPWSSIFGLLKGLSPYLLTRDPRISCVTNRHLLSSVVRTRGPKAVIFFREETDTQIHKRTGGNNSIKMASFAYLWITLGFCCHTGRRCADTQIIFE